MKPKYYLVMSPSSTAPSFHSQYIDEDKNICLYGYTTSESAAEDYIRQFRNKMSMCYVEVPELMVQSYIKKIGLSKIYYIGCEYGEDDEPSFYIVATDNEIEATYELFGDGFDTVEEDNVILQCNRMLKLYKTPAAKKARRSLRKFAAEIHEGDYCPHTKKWFITRMQDNGFR